ncbi:LAQU0S13e03158g1_1 [Lachancea quebecensis]|uniref:LAQU0S13e03158g1_1 n=1 Tax=Lachancea quebecensis TaxID=1654605 RepID=A0A0N7MM48_9SACH|nr:LAQU0S13e03158g1_1 [Lachancea quebecensis]
MLSSSNFSALAPALIFSTYQESHFSIENANGEVAIVSFVPNYSGHVESDAAVSRTNATFDEGVSWSKLCLEDPENELGCSGEETEACSLHVLHAIRSMSSHRQESTSGLSAFVGYVVKKIDEVNMLSKHMTFASKNGGKSWQKLLDFPAKLAVGGSCEVILAFPDTRHPNSAPLFYSIDQGTTWSELMLQESARHYRIFATSTDDSSSVFGGFCYSPERPFANFYILDFSESAQQEEPLDHHSNYLMGAEVGHQGSLQRRLARPHGFINWLVKSFNQMLLG